MRASILLTFSFDSFIQPRAGFPAMGEWAGAGGLQDPGPRDAVAAGTEVFHKKTVVYPSPSTNVVQIGEDENSFASEGTFQEVEYSHDARGLPVYILIGKRQVQGKTIVHRKPE